MDDETPTVPQEAAAPEPKRRGRPRTRLQDFGDAQSPKPNRPHKAKKLDTLHEIEQHEAALRSAGLLESNIPEASVLQDTPDEILYKLTEDEKRKVSLAEALARAAEIDSLDDGTRQKGNEYSIPLSAIPYGWHYEWKRDTVLNQRDPAYLVQLAKAGWRAVKRGRHPEMMPPDWPGDTIVRGGLILMEIPKVIADQRQAEALMDARGELDAKVSQINGRTAKDQPGAQPRRGSASREFGPILDINRGESAHNPSGRIIPH